jgi:alpha,alpha-trehalase
VLRKAAGKVAAGTQIALHNAKRAQANAVTMLRVASRDALTAADVHPAREYIAAYWTQLQRFHPKDDESLLGLPHAYLVPSYDATARFDYNELYYWDSYFMVQGLLDAEHEELVTGILEDLLSLFERLGIIPNASRTYLTGRSQPPFLTSFIFDVYDTYDKTDVWLARAIDIAKREYKQVWLGTRKPNVRLVYEGLSRYYDINYLNDLAEAESGWDMTPRFGRKALSFLPVDLNALLYKYEKDFERAAVILGKTAEAEQWGEAAEKRQAMMNTLMWDKLRGLYYDYNFKKEKRGNISSLAAYFTLWAGLANKHQAAAMVRALRRFEHRGGLTTTDDRPLAYQMPGSMPVQWAFPNGWAPLHFITVKGLERYGYHDEATRIVAKWLRTNLEWFNREGVFLEKYNVVDPSKPPLKGVYPSQTGFGWTNAVFERFCREYIDE